MTYIPPSQRRKSIPASPLRRFTTVAALVVALRASDLQHLWQSLRKPLLSKSTLAAFASILLLAGFATAGSLTPPGAPASTMNTLEELFDSIAGTFDSSTIVADQNGSLIEHLKYIEANMGGGVGSDSLDFDEFVDAMTLDDPTSVDLNTFDLGFTNGNVGIGTTTPTVGFEFVDTTGFGAVFRQDGGPGSLEVRTNRNGPVGNNGSLLFLTRSRGTDAVPLIVANTDNIGAITFQGYDGSFYLVTADITSIVDGVPGSFDMPGALLFWTTPDGSDTQVERMRIDNQGNVGIGTTTPNNTLQVAGLISFDDVELSTAIGSDALSSNTTGSSNTALGYQALFSNDTGSENTAVGLQAMLSNTTGGANTAVGVQALQFNTTGGANTAVGYSALSSNDGNNNTATGYFALFSNTTGSSNTANGYRALVFNDTGINNTAVGSGALESNTTGSVNTATGNDALFSNTTGTENTATGWLALAANTTGSQNTAAGVQALAANTTGFNNTAYGFNAGLSALGSGNIFLGFNAGNADTGSDALYIENSAAASSSALIYGEFDNDYLSFGANVSVSGNFDVAGHTAVGNSAGINDISLAYGALPAQVTAVVAENITADSGLLTSNISSYLQLDPSGAFADLVYGIESQVLIPAGNAQSFVSSMYPGSFLLSHSGSGTLADAGGINVGVTLNVDGDATTLYGVRVGNSNTGTGTITTNYQILVDTPGGTGAITNNYGVYVSDQNAVGVVNGYNIYSVGATSTNFFEGFVGVASVAPVELLSVEGDSRFSGHGSFGADGGVDNSPFIYFGGIPFSNVLTVSELMTDDMSAGLFARNGLLVDILVDPPSAANDILIGVHGELGIAELNTQNFFEITGAVNRAYDFGTGTIDSIYGTQTSGQNDTGTATNVYGLFAGAQHTGTGTTTNAYSIYADGTFTGIGVTNAYGVYIEPHAADGVAWNLYSAGLTQNFLGGNVGIGTTNIGQKLEVSGTASISGNVFMRGLSAANPADDTVCRNPATGEITFASTCLASSIKFKKNVEDLNHGLDWVNQLRPVTFDWKHNGAPSLGFIAQEVNEVTPLLALYQDGEVYSVNYQIMTSVLTKAIQELDGKIEDLSTSGPLDLDGSDWLGWDLSELFDAIVARFADLLGIGFGERTICLGETCINEEQLKELMEQGGVLPTEEPAPEDTPEATPESTPEETAEPTPESTPESTPKPEATPESEPETPEPAPEQPEETP